MNQKPPLRVYHCSRSKNLCNSLQESRGKSFADVRAGIYSLQQYEPANKKQLLLLIMWPSRNTSLWHHPWTNSSLGHYIGFSVSFARWARFLASDFLSVAQKVKPCVLVLVRLFPIKKVGLTRGAILLHPCHDILPLAIKCTCYLHDTFTSAHVKSISVLF